jgi:hypothetical protein
VPSPSKLASWIKDEDVFLLLDRMRALLKSLPTEII